MTQLTSQPGGHATQDIAPKRGGASIAGLSFGTKKETDVGVAYANQVAEINEMLALIRANGPVGLHTDPAQIGWADVGALDEFGYQLRRVVEFLVAEGKGADMERA